MRAEVTGLTAGKERGEQQSNQVQMQERLTILQPN